MKGFRRVSRRVFLQSSSVVAGGVLLSPASFGRAAVERKMTIDLVCGSIGVQADQMRAIELASENGFESVGPDVWALTGMSADDIQRVKARLGETELVFGAGGLPVEFRADQGKFDQDLAKLKGGVANLQKAGVTRIGTWIMSAHKELTYLENFKLHATRLRQTAEVLKDHGIRLGLEYVGPKTTWTSMRFPFVHTMAEMKELLAEIGTGNVGFVLDSWHWYTAEETEADLLSLKNEDIVAVDLNDAPEGIPVHEQMDLVRRLPAATGVIDVGTFLGALVKVGYDGPVRAEPFDNTLKSMKAEDAVAKTAAAMKKAFATFG